MERGGQSWGLPKTPWMKALEFEEEGGKVRSAVLWVVAGSAQGTRSTWAVSVWPCSDIQDVGLEEKNLHSGRVGTQTEPQPGLYRGPSPK